MEQMLYMLAMSAGIYYVIYVFVFHWDKVYMLIFRPSLPEVGDLYMSKIWKGDNNPFLKKPRVIVVDIQNGWIKFKGYREAGLVIGSGSCKVSRFLCDYMKA